MTMPNPDEKDIVARLRAEECVSSDEAADEIERLREALTDLLREVIDHDDPWSADHVSQIDAVVSRARAALSASPVPQNGEGEE
jgi:hypothetical protein